MQFRTYSELYKDIRLWCEHLPLLSGVCGVPRSGVLVASIMSQVLRIPLIPIEQLIGESAGFRPQCSRKLNKHHGPILVVDDTVWTGRTFNEIKLPDDVVKSALYGSVAGGCFVKYIGYRVTHQQHEFSYNCLNTVNCRFFATDMDGVLCRDFVGDDVNDVPSYEKFLVDAVPVRIPTHRVAAIVTARLEKYRHQTEVWLAKKGVAYDRLIMSPFGTAEERNRYGHGRWKSEVLSKLRVSMFIESDGTQAKEIATKTGLCTLAFLDDVCYNSKPFERLF